MKISRGFIALVVMLAITVAIAAFQGFITGGNSIFFTYQFQNTVINFLWTKIPASIKSFQIVTISAWIIYIVHFIAEKTFSKSNKAKTILGLIKSIIKWVVIIIAILLVLGAFGVDTSTLLASAGILALVIGLGAQSLIADIIAGFFIVFEGEYEVGDIITIDGFRGTVSDIGIRVTKVMDAGGNVKIINNSDIKNIINQTSELSYAKCTMSIDYGEDLKRVEEVFKQNIERLKKNVIGMVDDPIYKGVSELGSSSVNLLFIAKCKESDIYQVQRDMNRELYLIFNENNITIPFNQITVSYRDKNSEEEKHD